MNYNTSQSFFMAGLRKFQMRLRKSLPYAYSTLAGWLEAAFV